MGWGTGMINCVLSCAVDHSLLRLCRDEYESCKHAESFSGSYLGFFFQNQPAVETCPRPTPAFALGQGSLSLAVCFQERCFSAGLGGRKLRTKSGRYLHSWRKSV